MLFSSVKVCRFPVLWSRVGIEASGLPLLRGEMKLFLRESVRESLVKFRGGSAGNCEGCGDEIMGSIFVSTSFISSCNPNVLKILLRLTVERLGD